MDSGPSSRFQRVFAFDQLDGYRVWRIEQKGGQFEREFFLMAFCLKSNWRRLLSRHVETGPRWLFVSEMSEFGRKWEQLTIFARWFAEMRIASWSRTSDLAWDRRSLGGSHSHIVLFGFFSVENFPKRLNENSSENGIKRWLPHWSITAGWDARFVKPPSQCESIAWQSDFLTKIICIWRNSYDDRNWTSAICARFSVVWNYVIWKQFARQATRSKPCNWWKIGFFLSLSLSLSLSIDIRDIGEGRITVNYGICNASVWFSWKTLVKTGKRTEDKTKNCASKQLRPHGHRIQWEKCELETNA